MSGEITGLEPQAKRMNRMNIYLDGKYAFGLHRNLAAGLAIGERLDRARISELKQLDQQQGAYQRAAGLVARRPRSEAELKRRLAGYGLTEEGQLAVLARLQQAGLADDRAFARAWIENRMTFRPRSAYALRSELRSKGLSTETIREALDGFDEEEAARRAAEAGARKYRHLSPELLRNRLRAYLSRRGFKHHTVSSLLKRLAGEREHESEGTQ